MKTVLIQSVLPRLQPLNETTFRLTKNILILWPIFQPMGQSVTLIKDRLMLPPLAALGFVEILVAMLVLVWLANRYYKKHHLQKTAHLSD